MMKVYKMFRDDNIDVKVGNLMFLTSNAANTLGMSKNPSSKFQETNEKA